MGKAPGLAHLPAFVLLQLRAKGVDQRIIDAWVGHLSPEMVRRYRHLLPDQQKSAIDLVFGEQPLEVGRENPKPDA